MSYDEKIKMYLKHSKEDLAKMLIEANRTLDLLTNNEWFLGQHDPGGGLKKKYEEGFVEYLKLPKATILSFPTNEMYTNKWFVQTGKSIVAPTPHRHFNFDEFVQYCQSNQDFKERFVKCDSK